MRRLPSVLPCLSLLALTLVAASAGCSDSPSSPRDAGPATDAASTPHDGATSDADAGAFDGGHDDASAPGELGIALALDRATVAAGEAVLGTAALTNRSAAPVTIRRALVTSRRPGATHAGGPFDDFVPGLGPTTIDPGASVPLVASRAFTVGDPPGDWEAYATYENDRGVWVDGPAIPFTVLPPSGPAPLALGAWIPGAPGDASRIDAFRALVGAAPAVVHWYQSWARFAEFPTASFDAVVTRGATPMLTWEPWDTSAGVTQPAYALRAIVAGDHDAYLQRWARAAVAWGQTLYLRFAHEMNGNWYPWSIGVNGNSAADYVAAWRHVVDIFRAEGATRVRWVWCPNVAYTGSTPFSDAYPGDGYVDWLGLDGYNAGTSRPGSAWRSLRDVFAASHDALVALSPRPMMIAEVASAEEGGDKAAWIRAGLLTDLPAALPRVQAVVWFHENKEADWRVNSSSASLAAFAEVAASAAYGGRLPP